MYETITFKWAIRALNPKSEADKKAIAHASAGIAYFILSTPSDNQKFYLVGYKNFTGELSTGSDWANTYQVEKLNKMDERRYGNIHA